MLESFTPGELQAGAYIEKTRRGRNGDITRISQRNKGTGIPASTWKRMQDGLIQPGPKTLEKLARFKNRYQYNVLRASGAPKDEAKRLSRAEFEPVMNRAAKYRYMAEVLAKTLGNFQKKKIDPSYILFHMNRSEKTLEDWEQYETALSI